MASRSLRSSISPFRSRRSPAPPTAHKPGARPTTPSSSTSSRPTTPSSVASVARPAQHSSKLTPVSPPLPSQLLDRPDFAKSKENVTVTVRFRPLSGREINKGDEIAWYADGDYTVRNEYNPSIAYGFG
ncbi:hypothetical protein GW17_00024184 [Ensete ventricosum]|nr:hypothetical protein GW17_00024184 [Ensete ventricosum]